MPLAISQPRGFEAAQKSKIQLEAVYTFKGGMLAVAINDFIQAAIISFSLIFMFFIVSNMAGGAVEVFDFAVSSHKMIINFDPEYPNYTYVGGVLLSMILLCGCACRSHPQYSRLALNACLSIYQWDFIMDST